MSGGEGGWRPPRWVRVGSATVGLAVIGAAAVDQYQTGQPPSPLLIAAGLVMIGADPSDFIDRIWPGGR